MPSTVKTALFLSRKSNIRMLGTKTITVVLPAFNAGKTLESTYREIPHDIVDNVVLVDDKSSDNTVEIAKKLGITHVIVHDINKGYGANQKSCYRKALELKSDIIIMLHPDYQYTPKLIPSMASLIESGLYDMVLASRILGNSAIKGGMPVYKYIFNRILTFLQNFIMRQKLSEYHSGYRAFSSGIFNCIDIDKNSDDFVFDNQMIAQVLYAGFSVAEVSCPTKYFPEASSINFGRSIRYGLGVLMTSLSFALAKTGIYRAEIFQACTAESRSGEDLQKDN